MIKDIWIKLNVSNHEIDFYLDYDSGYNVHILEMVINGQILLFKPNEPLFILASKWIQSMLGN